MGGTTHYSVVCSLHGFFFEPNKFGRTFKSLLQRRRTRSYMVGGTIWYGMVGMVVPYHTMLYVDDPMVPNLVADLVPPPPSRLLPSHQTKAEGHSFD